MCYIDTIMIRRTLFAITGAVLLGLFTAGPKAAGEETHSFQLVYHSDTRGYYSPCG